MATPQDPPPSFSGSQRWSIALNTFLAVVAVLALVVMANYLAAGYFKRLQLSRDAAFKLSDQTIHVLDSLTNDVNITIFFHPTDENAEIYQLTKSLLNEYQRTNPKRIHVSTLDYTRFIGAAKELLATNNIGGMDQKDFLVKDFVIFQSNGHSKFVFAGELAQFDYSDLLAGKSKYVRRSAYKGEMYFTGDIYAVSYPQALKTYFLTGHGENDPGDPTNPDAKLPASAYSKLASVLKKEINCDWDRLLLRGTNSIPPDCQLLIVAAGAHSGRIPSDELAKISLYLKQGGRMLALLNGESGLEGVLEQWGVTVRTNRVVDLDPADNVDRYTFYAQWVPDHPIVDPLANQKLPLLMILPRPVYGPKAQSKVPGAPEVKYLAVTSTNSVDESGDKGVFPLLVAVEQGVINGVNSTRSGGTRIVVGGDTDFLDDQVIDQVSGNRYFAGLALNWLLDRPQVLLAGLGPQPIREYRLYMTKSQTATVQWLFLAAMPGGVLALGALVWLRRRS
ncbi:MAG TPA: Gldg family protein [Verrucomicrobiae bacterium]|jgi:hypothetical protein